MAGLDVLDRLSEIIHKRSLAEADQSYTRKLLDGGPSRCAKKLGEEAVEAVIAVMENDRAAIASEAADLVYHLLVALELRGVPFADVLGVLEERMSQSGLAEKAARSGKLP